MTKQETSPGNEAPEKKNWPKIKGPIDNSGDDCVLDPVRHFFSVRDQEDSSSGSTSDLFADSLSDSSPAGPSDAAHTTIGADSSPEYPETGSNHEVKEYNSSDTPVYWTYK